MHFFCLTLLLIPAALGADTLVSQGVSVLNPAAGTPFAFNFGSGFPFGPLAGLALASTCAPRPAAKTPCHWQHPLYYFWCGRVSLTPCVCRIQGVHMCSFTCSNPGDPGLLSTDPQDSMRSRCNTPGALCSTTPVWSVGEPWFMAVLDAFALLRAGALLFGTEERPGDCGKALLAGVC